MNDEVDKSEDKKEFENDSAFLQKRNQSNSSLLEDTEIYDIVSIENQLNNTNFEESEELPTLLQCDYIDINHQNITIFPQKSEYEEAFPEIGDDNDVSNAFELKTLEKSKDNHEAMHDQIENIQKQLRKLSHLPQLIQTAIEDITNQVSELMPAIKFENFQTDIQDSFCKKNEEQFHSVELLPKNINANKIEEEECRTSNEEQQLIPNSCLLDEENEYCLVQSQEQVKCK